MTKHETFAVSRRHSGPISGRLMHDKKLTAHRDQTVAFSIFDKLSCLGMSARHKWFLCIFSVLTVVYFPAIADVYKWVDGNGTVQYGDRPPGSGKVQKLTDTYQRTSQPGSPAISDSRPSLAEQNAALNRRRIMRDDQECAGFAREVIKSETVGNRLAHISRFNANCGNRKFDCTTFKKAPEKNKCELTQALEGKAIIRNVEWR